jgi:uncharacterized hydantoinase/oxoprolinase family protein
MEIHHLSFAKIAILNTNIAEIVVDEGVELNGKMTNELHHFLLTNLDHPFSLLINKINSYSYTCDAQMTLGAIAELKSIAVVVYSNISKVITQDMGNIDRPINWHMEIFEKKTSALTWLVATQSE